MTLQEAYKRLDREKRDSEADHVDHELAKRDNIYDRLCVNLVRLANSWGHRGPWIAHHSSPCLPSIVLNTEYVNGL